MVIDAPIMPEEHFAMMGYSLPGMPGSEQWSEHFPFPSEARQMKPCDIRFCIGNAMHLHACGCAIAFGLVAALRTCAPADTE